MAHFVHQQDRHQGDCKRQPQIDLARARKGVDSVLHRPGERRSDQRAEKERDLQPRPSLRSQITVHGACPPVPAWRTATASPIWAPQRSWALPWNEKISNRPQLLMIAVQAFSPPPR